MTAVATAIIGSAVIGAVVSKQASDDAIGATSNWRHRAIDVQEEQYAQTREDYGPWLEAGGAAVNRLDRASTGDMSDFQTSPGYNFRRDEGMRGMENRFSVGGGGGNAMKALSDWNQNMASNEYGNWWNRQAGLAGVGQQATGSTAMFGANAANQIAGQYGAIGDNEGSIGLWNAANVNNALQSGLSNYLYSRNQSQPQYLQELDPGTWAPKYPGG